MARDWEAQFREWARPPGKTEQDRCDNAASAIRNAIKASDTLRSRSVSIFAQGSYRNNTNVRKDSDVDIGVLCIQPKIPGVIIHPVPLSIGPDHVAYVVEVPQGATAHQASDRRYYRRHNFKSEPMEDYEIRDVMDRDQHPQIDVDIALELRRRWTTNTFSLPNRGTRYMDLFYLAIRAHNRGRRSAGVVVPPREARGSVLPMLGRLRRPGFQRLEEPTGPASKAWKPGQTPCTAGQDRG